MNADTALARPWRVAFLLYLLALTVGTHWPRLDLGPDEGPSPDKLVHFVAFGALAILLRRTRWMRSVGAIGLAVLAWILVDEWTQSLPVLEREFSATDVAAGVLGLLAGLAWLAALRPGDGPVAAALDLTFQRTSAWIVTAAGGAAFALLILVLWPRLPGRWTDPGLVLAVLGCVVAATAAAGFVLLAWERRAAEELGPLATPGLATILIGLLAALGLGAGLLGVLAAVPDASAARALDPLGLEWDTLQPAAALLAVSLGGAAGVTLARTVHARLDRTPHPPR